MSNKSQGTLISPAIERKSKAAKRKGKKRHPLSTLQAQDNGTPNRQTPRSASKKHDDAFKLPKRPMSPILPEIPVFVLNENGMFVEEDKHIPQKPVMRDGDSQTDTTASQDKSIQTDPEVPIDLRMVTEEFPPIEYWILTAENQKAELKKLRSDIEALHEEIDHLKGVLQGRETVERNAEYFAFMYKVVSSY